MDSDEELDDFDDFEPVFTNIKLLLLFIWMNFN